MHIEMTIHAENRVVEKAAALVRQAFKDNMGASYWSIDIKSPSGGSYQYKNEGRGAL